MNIHETGAKKVMRDNLDVAVVQASSLIDNVQVKFNKEKNFLELCPMCHVYCARKLYDVQQFGVCSIFPFHIISYNL